MMGMGAPGMGMGAPGMGMGAPGMGMQPGMAMGVGYPPGVPNPGTANMSIPGSGAVAVPPGSSAVKPDYHFKGAEEGLQMIISNLHIGSMLLGLAAVGGFCLGRSMAGKAKAEESDSEDE